MKPDTWIGMLLIFFVCILPGCGGGNVVSNSTDGILSIESVTAPTTVGGQGSVRIKLIAPSGGPGTGTITIASDSSNLVSFSPTSQSINSSGEATFFCTAKEIENDTLTTFTVSTGSLSLTNQMAIIGTGAMTINISAPASADMTGTITATFTKGTQAAGRKITLSSDVPANVALDTAEQPADASGKAVFTYRILNIIADTTITFTAKSDSQTVSKGILIPVISANPAPVVINPLVNSIAFVSASPTSIAIKGTGGSGRTETSIVTFVVRDVTGQPLSGQAVDFTLDTSVGGITLFPESATSDSMGLVRTIVNAGVVSTPVRTTATVRNKSISSKSDQLIISTGLPHQDGLSVSATIRNPEAWNFDGLEVPVTVMLADHFGNPVPDGTAVYFMTYGGSIEANGITKNGISSVMWRSQNPRPADGKAKILVYAIGEESFTDLNGNGLADSLVEFSDIPESFLSKSGSTTRNPTIDPFIDFNGDGVYNTGDGKFNGILQGNAYLGAPRSLHIFKNYQITMSGSQAVILPATLPILQNKSTTVSISIRDENGNSLPDKTTATFTSTAGGCTASKGFAITPASKTINNTGSQTELTTNITNECTSAGSGNVIVTVKTPKGIETVKEIAVTY